LQSIILVGGKGTRLRPLTYETPKQMLPLVGVAMIECVLGSLARHGVTDAVLSLGYLPDRFIEAYPTNVIAGVNVTYAVEPEPLDTAGAIRFAANFAEVDDTFLVVNGDVVTDLDVTALLKFHRASGGEATIALHPVEEPSHFGVVATEADGRVLAFIEKPPPGTAPTNLINAGTYVFEPAALERIAPTGRVSVERDTFPKLVAAKQLFAMSDHAYWLDTGTPQLYLQANVDILLGRNSQDRFKGIVDGSWTDSSATIDPSVALHHSVVDAGCIVGANVVLEDAVLLPGAVVQSGCEIRSSIVGPEAVIGTNSVLGPTCVVGAKEHVAAESRLSGDVRLGGV
jgi:mannose-1-phosphate guanylyltransferase